MTALLIEEMDEGRYLITAGDRMIVMTLPPGADVAFCACMECAWLGIAAELSAQACPQCDGRVCDQGSPEFTERLKARAPQ